MEFVSMLMPSTEGRLQPGAFWGTLRLLGERGCGTPGTLHQGQPICDMGSLNKPVSLFGQPVRLHLTGNPFRAARICV